MFFKFIELSRYLIKCSPKCQRYPEGTNLLKDTISNAFRNQSTQNFKHFIITFSKDEFEKLFPLIKRRSLLILLAKELKQIEGILKENTIKVTKCCVSQFEFVVAHRVRRAQQVFSLYTKLWDDTALRLIIYRLRKQFLQGGKAFVLGLSAGAVINWDEEIIKDQEIIRHSRELDMCHRLKGRKPLPKDSNEIHPCVSCDSDQEDGCWEPFVTSGDLTCWKREAPSRKGTGLFCYKMYGVYSDVSANDFLEAFLDIKERKTWDSHVVDLHVIASDPQSNSDIIYWETKWPTLFNNRDYVFKRRYKILEKEKLIIICNKSSSHPDYPVHTSKTRVTEYWSYMVIKPFSKFCKPGIEFSLTYFDDPGTSLPSAISSWASTTGMPEFMKKLRLAAKQIATLRASQGTAALIPDDDCIPTTPTPGTEKEESKEEYETCEVGFFEKLSQIYPPSDEDDLLLLLMIT